MAGIELTTNFDVKTGLPLDSRITKADLTARNAIPALERYLGLEVYVLSEKKKYILKDGLLDTDWVESGGSGGGSSLVFVPDTDNGVFESYEYKNKIFIFDAYTTVSEYQRAVTTIKVPSSYQAGTQLKLKMTGYSKHASGTKDIRYALIRTLFAKDTGDISSGSINTVFSEVFSVSPFIIKEFVFDLTDATGQIAGTAIAAGDIIRLQLLRDQATIPANGGTEQAAVLVNSFEIV